MMKEVYYVKGLGMCRVIQVLQLIYYSLFGTEKYGEEEMVKNDEICQFLDQIHHKNVHHCLPFFTIFHHFSPFFKTLFKGKNFAVRRVREG